MAVKIRLNRIGTTKRPFYRIVATDSRFPQGGRALETLGTYDPKNLSLPRDSGQKEAKGLINLKTDRVQYWLSVGAQPTDTTRSLLKRLNLWPLKKTSDGSETKASSTKTTKKSAAKKKAA